MGSDFTASSARGQTQRDAARGARERLAAELAALGRTAAALAHFVARVPTIETDEHKSGKNHANGC
jgi:hypothetical protein